MNENDKIKVIFLDIDGVLNGVNLESHIICTILSKINRDLLFKWDLFGIRWKYVFRLWVIVKLTDAKIVMSSSWRGGLNMSVQDLFNQNGRHWYELFRKFSAFKLQIVDRTKYVDSIRGLEINNWIESHPYIKSYVVLDDEIFDIKDHIPSDNIVHTTNPKYKPLSLERGCYWRVNSGLRWRHVIRAVRILNRRC